MGSQSDPRTRLTQAERSAISRDKIVRAAVQCLAHVGYNATSFALIAATAGISTGRMQHHYANKADIMGAVVDFVRQQTAQLLSLRKLKAQDPRDRVLEYVQLVRRNFEGEYVPAVLEIRVAMKGDRELAAVVEPLFQLYDARAYSDLEDLLMAAGMPQATAHVWMRLVVSTLRGMAVERVAAYRILDQVDTETALDTLARQMLAAIEPAHAAAHPAADG